MQPGIKLRKQFHALRNTFTFGCNYDVTKGSVLLITTWKDFPPGGSLSFTNFTALEWHNTLLLPGIADAATSFKLSASCDLRTRAIDARLQLGLRRRLTSSSISLVHTLPLDGANENIRLDAGATLNVPAVIDLSLCELRGRAAHDNKLAVANVEPMPALLAVDFDRLDLRIEF